VRHHTYRVVKKHSFHGIQQKIPQNSNFAKKRDLNPIPNGEVAEEIEKMFANFFC
jgi:beta-galactosidase beta subunit